MNTKIIEYQNLIIKFNKKINLISRKDIDNLTIRHIDDGILSHSAYASNYRVSPEYSFYDLGSGNGIPGMIWAILEPQNKFYLIDTDERKCEFLKYVAQKLDLTNVLVKIQDFNTIRPDNSSIFLNRGLMSIEDFLVPDNVFTGFKGFFVKGSTWNTEIGDIQATHFESSDYPLKDGSTRSLVFYKP